MIVTKDIWNLSMRDFERNGCNLTASKTKEFIRIKTEIGKNEGNFIDNISSSSTKCLQFEEEDLKGCSKTFIEGLKRTDEEKKIIFPLGQGNIKEVLTFCSDPKTRRIVYEADQSKCQDENSKILEDTIRLRRELVGLFDAGKYTSFLSYQLEGRMIGNQENLENVIGDLTEKMYPVFESEVLLMRDLKREEMKDETAEIETSDLWYYMRIIMEKRFNLDQKLIQEYFPAETTIPKILSIFGNLMDLEFELIIEASEGEKWHSDVIIYKVIDSTTKEVLSKFYLDLYPREGKYSDFATYSAQPGFLDSKNKVRVAPIATMVANFNQSGSSSSSSSNKPSFFTVEDLEIFCHELGHLLHLCCSKVKYARFSGFEVVFDFCEVPSTTLELFAHEVQFLLSTSSHYQTQEKLPLEICQRIADSRKSDGLLWWYHRKLRRTRFDMLSNLETSSSSSLQELWNKNNFEVTKIPQNPNLNGSSSFVHIMLPDFSYAGGHYVYIWSKIIACDVFSCWRSLCENYDVYVEGEECREEQKKYKSILDCVEIGKKFREKILLFGGEKDPNLILKDFLGRESNMKSFFNSI